MSWVAVNKDSTEVCFHTKPFKQKKEECIPTYFDKMKGQKKTQKFKGYEYTLVATGLWVEHISYEYETEYDGRMMQETDTMEYQGVSLPKGSIKKLIGRELTWEDEAVELKEE